MTHLPFIVAAYALALGIVSWLVTDAILRTARAKRRLAAVDPRAERRA